MSMVLVVVKVFFSEGGVNRQVFKGFFSESGVIIGDYGFSCSQVFFF